MYTETLDLVVDGNIYGISTAGFDQDPARIEQTAVGAVDRFCNATSSMAGRLAGVDISLGSVREYTQYAPMVAQTLCRMTLAQLLDLIRQLLPDTFGDGCLDWSLWGPLLQKVLEAGAPDELWLYDLLEPDKPSLCVEKVDGEPVLMVSVTPGQWITKAFWTGRENDLALFGARACPSLSSLLCIMHDFPVRRSRWVQGS